MHSVRKNILRGFLFIVLVWILGFAIFYAYIPMQVGDSVTQTQAIVVLTGGRERVKTGFQLLCEKKAASLFISGVHREETLTSLLKLAEVSQIIDNRDIQHFKPCVFLGHIATNTHHNALETALWVRQHSIRSIRLVTAAYHLPRSLLEIKEQLPDITIIPHPVFPGIKQNDDLAKQVRLLRLAFIEYHKYLLAVARISLVKPVTDS